MPSDELFDPPLNFEQVRVLGCLLEKEMTLPEYYPLTLNALITACNQSTNRDPVTSFDEATVVGALEGLRQRQLVFQLSQAGARVPKFRHNCDQQLPDLDRPQRALLCTLLLRGSQTVGELRQRSERMHAFPDVESVEECLDSLITREAGALVQCLPAGGGRRVPSYRHLLAGAEAETHQNSPRLDARPESIIPPEPSWKEEIERQLEELRREIRSLKEQLGVADDA